MSDAPGSLLHYLRHVTGVLRTDPRTDAELLQEFIANRNERAFVSLVWRHGPLVWRTCLSVLHNERDAEDAFQATFLALARQAGEIRTETLPNWLTRVAQRTSLNVRKTATRRARRHEQLGRQMLAEEQIAVDASVAATVEDTRSLVRDELTRMPERLRAVLTLYYFHGHTQVQVGEMLGVTEQTVRKRLTLGIAELQERLGRRGMVMNGLVLGSFLGPDLWAANGELPVGLATKAAGAAVAYADGRITEISAAVLALAARTMAPPVPFLPLIAGFALVVASGVGSVWAYHQSAKPEQPVLAVQANKPPILDSDETISPEQLPLPNEKPAVRSVKPVAILSGQVRDHEGRAVPFARMTALVSEPQFGQAGLRDRTLGQTVADAEGRYQLSVPPFRASDASQMRVKLLATAPDGQGLGTKVVPLQPGVDTEPVEVAVQPARAISGHIVAPSGEPVVGALIRVMEMADVIRDVEVGDPQSPVAGWPAPVYTDDGGRFILRGAIADSGVLLTVDHPEHAYQLVKVLPQQTGLEIRLGSPRRLSGRVLDDHGQPVSSARVVAVSMVPAQVPPAGTRPEGTGGAALTASQLNGVFVWRNVRADSGGRFEFSVPAGIHNRVWVHPKAEGTESLAVTRGIHWPAEVPKHSLGDVHLPRGRVIHGRVVDDAESAVANATIQFLPNRDPGSPEGWRPLSGASAGVLADETGRFQLTVPFGPGKLLASGPTRDYVVDPDSSVSISIGMVGRMSLLTHAAIPFDPSNQIDDDLTVSLLRGLPLEATVELPDGTPVEDGWAVCHHLVTGSATVPSPIRIENGRFTLPGCRPGYVYSVLIRTADGRHGAYAQLSCAEDEESVVVTLQPCGTVASSYRTAAGTAAAGTSVSLVVVLDAESSVGAKPKKAPTILPYTSLFDHGPAARAISGDDGRVVFAGLVPGAQHMIWQTDRNLSTVRGFTPREGKTLVLPPALATPRNAAKQP